MSDGISCQVGCGTVDLVVLDPGRPGRLCRLELWLPPFADDKGAAHLRFREVAAVAAAQFGNVFWACSGIL